MPVAGQAELNELVQFANDGVALATVAFGVAVEPQPIVFKVNLANSVEAHVRRGAARCVSALGDRELVAYDIGHRFDQYQVATTPLAENVAAASLKSALADLNAVPTFNDTGQMEHVGFIATVLTGTATPGGENRRAIAVQRVTPGRFHLKQGRFHRLLFANGTFSEVENNLVQFNDEYDAIIYEERCFIPRQEPFEALFGLLASRDQNVLQGITLIGNSLPLSDSNIFAELMASDRRYYRKLESVRLRGLYNKSIDEIETFVISRGIGLEFETVGGRRVIKVEDSREWRRRFLALLDDDNYRSELSGADYEANSKRVRQGGGGNT